MEGRTTILISHRASSAKLADHVIALQDGEVIEQGTHAELMEQGGYYRSLVEKLGVKGHLLIHAGQTWENRTFPQEWWQEVVDLCSRSRKCALIGMDMALDDGHKRGFVRVDCPEDCVDMRGKTSIRELIALISANDVLSNDSFPVHIAGAFDNWIFVIPTVKHPDLLLPFRKDRKSTRLNSSHRT